MPLDELEEHALAEKPYLKTDWSEPSAEITIPYDYKYYAQRVTESAAGQSIDVSIHTWLEETGTRMAADAAIKDVLKSRALRVQAGDLVGGEAKTYVLRMDKETLNQENTVFQSRDLLIFASPSPTAMADSIPELGTELRALRKSGRGLGSRMIVARPDGKLLAHCNAGPTLESDLSDSRDYMKEMASHFEYMKDTGSGSKGRSKRKSDPSDPGDGYPGAGGGYPGGGGGYPGGGGGYPGGGDSGYPGGGSGYPGGGGGYPGGGGGYPGGGGGYPGGGGGYPGGGGK